MSYFAWALSVFSVVSALNVDMGWWETSEQVPAFVLWGFASVYALVGLALERKND